MNIRNYMDDGANWQAQAVLAYLRNMTIEESWDDNFHRYTTEIEVARWHNCREQGYVAKLYSKDCAKQLNIIWFEHRNSDSICALKWEEFTINFPTIDSEELAKVYTDKWVSHKSVEHGNIVEMGEWISKTFNEWWIENSPKK